MLWPMFHTPRILSRSSRIEMRYNRRSSIFKKKKILKSRIPKCIDQTTLIAPSLMYNKPKRNPSNSAHRRVIHAHTELNPEKLSHRTC